MDLPDLMDPLANLVNKAQEDNPDSRVHKDQ